MIHPFRVFKISVVYAVRNVDFDYGGGETTAKTTAINIYIARLPPPRNAKNLCHKRICRH